MATKKWVEAPDALPDSMTVPIFPSSPFAKATDLSSPRSYLGGVEGEQKGEGLGTDEEEEGEEGGEAREGAGKQSAKPMFTADEEEGLPVGVVLSGEGTKFPPLKVGPGRRA
jgi:hypothetical protein